MMDKDKDLFYKIALTLVPKVGVTNAKLLYGHFESAQNVFEASPKELVKVPGVGKILAAEFKDVGEYFRLAEQELVFIEKHGIQAICLDSPTYPSRLRECPDAPFLFYYKGNADLNAQRFVGVVGTRNPTWEGIAFTERLVAELAAFQINVVSGLAFGVDISAHRACLQHGVPTLAVVGHGLKTIYPAEHRKPARLMLENGGVISEFSSSIPIKREHFPMRNRIVAGLCDTLVVVETDTTGGSMITAQLAFDYQREIMAVPGRPSDTKSKGCNLLIKTNRASIIENAADLIDLMGWGTVKKSRTTSLQLFHEFTLEERIVVDNLKQHSALHIDALMVATGFGMSVLSPLLLELEFKGVVRSFPGKRYGLIEG